MITNRHRGFTLIELVTVIAVVAILAVIALPSFADQLRKSRRAEAIATLQEQQLRLERHRVDNPSFETYVLPATGLGGSGHYTFAIQGAGPTAYTLVATPKAGQDKDKCGTLSLAVASGTTKKSPVIAGCW